MDKETRLALVGVLEASQGTMKNATDARLLSLRIHEALLKARVPGYLEAYESSDDGLAKELTNVKDKLAHFVDAGIQRLRKVCARSDSSGGIA